MRASRRRDRALCVGALLLAATLAGGCAPAIDDAASLDLHDPGAALSLLTDQPPLPCFEPVGDGEGDIVPGWRTQEPLAPLPITPVFGRRWSSSATIAARGDELAMASETEDAVVFVDAKTLTVTRKVPVGKGPAHVLYGPDGALWVSVRRGGAVARIAVGAAKATLVPVGLEPIGLAMSTDAERLYVGLAGDKRVVALSTKSLQQLEKLAFDVPERPRALVATDLGGKPPVERIVVALEHGPAFVRHVKHVPGGPAFDNRTAPLRAANPAHLATGEDMALPGWRSLSATIHPATGDALVPHVLVFTGDDAPSQEGPMAGSYNAAPGDRCSSTPLRPIEVSLSAIGHQTASPQPSAAVRDPYSKRQLIARFDQPTAVVHLPTASIALVTAAGTDNVLVLNTALPDPMAAPLGEITVGAHPDGIAVSEDGKTAWVRDAFGHGVSELNLAPLLATVAPRWLDDDNGQAIGPRMAPRFLAASRHALLSKDPLSSRMRQGRDLFHRAKNPKISAFGRFACASCHLEGGDDKQVWHIGAGPRQTPSLAGRLAGTAPFNWKGTETELVGNMRQTIDRMGGHGLSGGEEKALEKFLLHGLPAPPKPAKTAMTPAQARGMKLFFDPIVGCASCHSPPAFTDGKQHAIGTINSVTGGSNVATHCSPGAAATMAEEDAVFDTPSLLGVRHTAPYLHDGSAQTLADVLDRTAGTMGNTSHLDGNQRADLIAFLLTL